MLRTLLSRREEANVITCYPFRNGFIEDVHSGGHCITQERMKKLMIESSARIEKLLRMKDEKPKKYAETIYWFHHCYSKQWEKLASTYELPKVEQFPRPVSSGLRDPPRPSWKEPITGEVRKAQ